MAERDSGVGLGLIGCGSFGEFCLETYLRIGGLRLAAVADTRPSAADRLARRFHVPAVYAPAELIARADVDLVHLATPPATHYELGLAATRAGKHMLCEKPLATRLDHARDMLEAARDSRVILPVNFVLRYNGVTDAVKAVVESGLLGRPLYASLENFASDEQLGPTHWFWEKAVSGGIFIEHGVHFFDLYRHWLGPGQVVSAHVAARPAVDVEDRVMCTVRHDSGAMAHHYHGFDQPARLDRTTHRLLLEIGDIYVHGWIPTDLVLTAIVDAAGQAELERICPGAAIDVLESYDTAEARRCRGRGRQREVDRKIRLTWCPGPDKMALYRAAVHDLLVDQLAFIADPSHARRVTEQNGYDALALAASATEMSR